MTHPAVLVAIGLVVILVILAIIFYNRLVRLRQHVRESWSAIDTELRRRYDLIPNMVETVKGYASHERGTLEAVISARNAAVASRGTPEEQAKTENQFVGAMRQLFAVAEAYPELKANENFQALQKELGETETRLSQARRFYNANVREMNLAVESFPSSIFAGMFGFPVQQYFEVEDSARGPVTVKF